MRSTLSFVLLLLGCVAFSLASTQCTIGTIETGKAPVENGKAPADAGTD